jgi:hypothetical protein
MIMLDRLAKIAFFAALLFTFYSAVIPPAHALQLVPWDKAEHFIAFYALTGLAAAAFPKRNLIIIALLLSGFGACIEFVQGLPMVHRDRDVWDWFADTIAIIAALSPMLLVWWRGIDRSAGGVQRTIANLDRLVDGQTAVRRAAHGRPSEEHR